VAAVLARTYPGSAQELCALTYNTPFQLLVATILSAQCTDSRVNQVSPALFARFGTPAAMARATEPEIEEMIRPTGFYHVKARHILQAARVILESFGGRVPEDLESLTSLPGVGRKTANVVRSVAFGLPGLPVDTHVGRLSRRLGLTTDSDPVRIEAELCDALAPQEWGVFSIRLILHGRAVCLARSPACASCVLGQLCPRVGV